MMNYYHLSILSVFAKSSSRPADFQIKFDFHNFNWKLVQLITLVRKSLKFLQIILKVQNIYKLSALVDFGCFSFPTKYSATPICSRETAISCLICMPQERFLHEKMHNISAYIVRLNQGSRLNIVGATAVFVKHIGP